MKFLVTSSPDEIAPNNLPIPKALEQYLLPSADSIFYRKYPFGHVLSQEHNLTGVKIHHYYFFTDLDSSFYAYFTEPTIAFQFMATGSVKAMLQQLHTYLAPERCGLFFIPASMNEVKVYKGFSCSIHFELSEKYAEDIASTHPNVKELMAKLFSLSEKAERLDPIPVDYEIKMLLDKIKSLPAHDEGNLEMDFKAIIIPLLNIYRKRLMSHEKSDEPTHVAYESVIIEIGENIMARPNKGNFTIAKLTAKYKITEYTLKTGFRIIWKSSLRNFLMKYCMEKSKSLAENRNLSMANIAEEIGYENASNFSKAFKNYYGRPFGDYRPD